MTPKAVRGLSYRCSVESLELSSERKRNRKMRKEKDRVEERANLAHGLVWSPASAWPRRQLWELSLCCRVDPIIPVSQWRLSFLEEREERDRSRGTVTFSIKAAPICWGLLSVEIEQLWFMHGNGVGAVLVKGTSVGNNSHAVDLVVKDSANLNDL